ncbi:MAG TPA: quinate 5-dehydrogenase [Anaerolineae bacterium]|nr:quinate 5-dehydrogenase [Anaerolineae bacterium]
MKHAVSVSLGSPARDKRVEVMLNEERICIERIGTGGDEKEAQRLFNELDGKVDALAVGGIDLYVRMDGRDYPIHSALKLVKDVHQTPVVDGRLLKYALESRVFELAKPMIGEAPHFQKVFMPSSVDRIGLTTAVSAVSDEVVIGDLMFILDIPIPVRGLEQFKKIARILLPIVGYLPISMILPPGSKEDTLEPKHQRFWREADLIAGDMHYIRKYAPDDLDGKWVITNTTTPENIELLRKRGVNTVITTTPRYEGRSFGVNMMEGVLTAYAGLGRPLSESELNGLIDELDLRPSVQRLNE